MRRSFIPTDKTDSQWYIFHSKIERFWFYELSVWAVYTMFMLHLKCLREKVETLSAMLLRVVLIKINNTISQSSWMNKFCSDPWRCMSDCVVTNESVSG